MIVLTMDNSVPRACPTWIPEVGSRDEPPMICSFGVTGAKGWRLWTLLFPRYPFVIGIRRSRSDLGVLWPRVWSLVVALFPFVQLYKAADVPRYSVTSWRGLSRFVTF